MNNLATRGRFCYTITKQQIPRRPPLAVTRSWMRKYLLQNNWSNVQRSECETPQSSSREDLERALPILAFPPKSLGHPPNVDV